MYQFSHDGVTVTVRPAAPGRHTVVFVNGLFGGGWIWAPVVDALAADGYGTVVTTEPLAAHLTADDVPALVQSISLLIDALPDPSPILCGNSLGALVAMELAAAAPGRWAGAVLSGAPGLGDGRESGAAEPGSAADSFGAALRTPSLRLGRLLAERLIHDKTLITADLVDRCTAALTPRVMLRAGRALRATRDYDARPLLGLIDAPVLLLFGACDEISSPAAWRAAAPLFADAGFVELSNAGHSPMLERPDAFAQSLTSWLDTLPVPNARPLATATTTCVDTPRDRYDEIVDWLVDRLSGHLAVSPSAIDLDRTFGDYGVDSSFALTLCTDMERDLGVLVEPTFPWDYPTITAVADRLTETIGALE